ncbi:hypothetical protein GP486_004717, partial [Trichoglossum hirsutum]
MSSSNSSSHPYPPADPSSADQLAQMQQAIRAQYAHQHQSNQHLLIQAATSALASSPSPFMNSGNPNTGSSNSSSGPTFPQLSASTEEILKRVGAAGNPPGWEAAKKQVMQSMATTQNMPTPPPIQSTRRRSAAARQSLGTSGSPPTTRGGRGGGRGGRGGGRKKRGTVKQESDDSDRNSSGSDSGAPFTMDGTKTKSGRKVHRPAHFDPAAKTPTRRRGPYRRMHEATVCRVCQRGHSPASNMIVYCDGCNTPYHQLCHDPVISEEVVRVEEKEWICAGCNAVKEGRSKAGTSGEGYNPED